MPSALQQLLYIEWNSTTELKEAEKQLKVHNPKDALLKQAPHINITDIPEKQPMRMHDFLLWAQTWIVEQVNAQLYDFELGMY